MLTKQDNGKPFLAEPLLTKAMRYENSVLHIIFLILISLYG